MRTSKELSKLFIKGNKEWTKDGFIDYIMMINWLMKQKLDLVSYAYDVFRKIDNDDSKIVLEHIEYVIVHKELIGSDFPSN